MRFALPLDSSLALPCLLPAVAATGDQAPLKSMCLVL